MKEILENAMFWYAIAVGLFVLALVIYARKPILGWLDSEIIRIRFELDQAKKLRAEAAATLADYQKRRKEALQEAEAILARAKADAEKLRAEAEADLKETLVRYEHKAEARIRMAEEEALAEVRAVVINEAVAAARKALENKLDPAMAEKITNQAIGEIPVTSSGPKAA